LLYAILSEDITNSLEKRKSVSPAHIERLQILQDAGRLIIAGPHPAIDSNNPGDAGFTGSLVIAEFSTLADAEKWANEDPYLAAGAYAKVSVKPFKQVFPNDDRINKTKIKRSHQPRSIGANR
jgi:uncharacterized protein YciI